MRSFRLYKNFGFDFISDHIVYYPTPINFNYLNSFGSIAGICLVIQILSGVFLAMNYIPNVELAFNSVEHIMRDINYGWLLRYMHANGSSFFFIVLYIHIFRGIYYGSYVKPREILWVSGIIIFILVMATAFLGYVLPWGQMSFWGATVITNIFSSIPLYGQSIVDWLWGGFSVDQPTLNRFFSLHFLIPFLISGVVILHLSLLHNKGSNNSLGINTNIEQVNFFPFLVIKDIFSLFIYFIFFFFFVMFLPNTLGHSDNYILASPLQTPAHIVPEWYFLPYYALLRAVPNKLGGVICMFGAIVILGLLPWLNTSKIRSSIFRPGFKLIFWVIFVLFLILGWLGQQPIEYPYIQLGILSTFLYFFIFLIILPLIGILENSYLGNNKFNIIFNKNINLFLNIKYFFTKVIFKK